MQKFVNTSVELSSSLMHRSTTMKSGPQSHMGTTVREGSTTDVKKN